MSTRKEQLKQQREAKREQREYQEEQKLIQRAFNADDEVDPNWMEKVLNVDDIEARLQPATVEKVCGLLNDTWFLSNLNDAQVNDRIHKLKVMKKKLIDDHPPEESHVTGATRAFLFDDGTEKLEPLSASERNILDQFFTTMENQVPRSSDGFERKQIDTKIARSERGEDHKESSSGGLSGLFS